jgi:hypothetical protein
MYPRKASERLFAIRKILRFASLEMQRAYAGRVIPQPNWLRGRVLPFVRRNTGLPVTSQAPSRLPSSSQNYFDQDNAMRAHFLSLINK